MRALKLYLECVSVLRVSATTVCESGPCSYQRSVRIKSQSGCLLWSHKPMPQLRVWHCLREIHVHEMRARDSTLLAAFTETVDFAAGDLKEADLTEPAFDNELAAGVIGGAAGTTTTDRWWTFSHSCSIADL